MFDPPLYSYAFPFAPLTRAIHFTAIGSDSSSSPFPPPLLALVLAKTDFFLARIWKISPNHGVLGFPEYTSTNMPMARSLRCIFDGGMMEGSFSSFFPTFVVVVIKGGVARVPTRL